LKSLVLSFSIAAGLTAAACVSHAQDAKSLQLRSLAATCAGCHGTDGRAVATPTVPGLAGLSETYITEQMQAFKNNPRGATVMHQIAKGYSDAQIAQLAAYFAAQPK
jgi:sulfide dehydrogenase cytochrome subunit